MIQRANHAISRIADQTHPPPAPIDFDRSGLDDATLLRLYEALLLPRAIEDRMLVLLRQGRVSKWFSGMGQEAIAVGITAALRPDDTVFPLHRNLGVFTARGLPLERLFAQWQGKAAGYTRGRDRSFHFGAPSHHVIGMISHLGAMLGVADGVALGNRLAGGDQVAVAFSGDGGASEGDFHEAINTAAVWDLPVLFVVESNGYGLSTPSSDQFRCASFAHKGKGYGIEAISVDGNDILEVYRRVTQITARMRQRPAPVLMEARTFRMRGHEEASGTRYVPQHLFDAWGKRDPISCYERFLIDIGILDAAGAAARRARLRAEIVSAWEAAEALPDVVPNANEELRDVYAPAPPLPAPLPIHDAAGGPRALRFVDAISEGLAQSMERDEQLVIMGQDVGDYGGVFKITEGFVQRFGRDRVRNTPLCESAILGAALGLSLTGHRAVVEMQFADFVSCGFNQIVNNLAKTHYRWGHPVNVTVRLPTGAGVGAGPFHSQSNEAWFAHVPGLKIVYPSTPHDAKGLLTTALWEPNPVLYFEHKGLYRGLQGSVPQGYYNLPIGVAAIVRTGTDATVVTYGAGCHWAQAAAAKIARDRGKQIEIVDLRSLLPWDQDTVFASVRKTNRVLILHEDTLFAGIGGEIAASITEHCFHDLDAPPLRLGALDTPVPFNRALEQQFLPRERLERELIRLLSY